MLGLRELPDPLLDLAVAVRFLLLSPVPEVFVSTLLEWPWFAFKHLAELRGCFRSLRTDPALLAFARLALVGETASLDSSCC